MTSDSNLKVFVPFSDKSDLIFSRTRRYVENLVAEFGGQTVADCRKEVGVAHLLSVRSALDYEALLREKRIPYVIQAFAGVDEYLRGDEYQIDLKKETLRIYNAAKAVLVFWPSQKLLLRHLGVTSPIEVVHPVGESYSRDDFLNQEAFHAAYGLPPDQRTIVNFGVYDPDNGFDEYESLARIMPDLEFYFYGVKTTLFNSSAHYASGKSTPNLHYEDSVPDVLYPSLIVSSTALVLTGSFHIESLVIADMMASRLPIVSNKNPVLFDLLIKDKTAIIAEDIDQLYQAIHDITVCSEVDKAFDYISQFDYKSEAAALQKVYASCMVAKS